MINLFVRAIILFCLAMAGVPLWVIVAYAATESFMMVNNGLRVTMAEAKTMETVLNSDGPDAMPKNYRTLYKALVKQGKV